MSEGRYCINLRYRHPAATNGELVENPDGTSGRLGVIHPETEENGEHVVTFICGVGFIYTAPLDAFRVATPEEKAEVARGCFCQPWAPPYQIPVDDPGWWDGSDPKTWGGRS